MLPSAMNKPINQMNAEQILNEVAHDERDNQCSDRARLAEFNAAFHALTGMTVAQGLDKREKGYKEELEAAPVSEHKIKLSKTFLTINGKRCGIRFSANCWISCVNPDTIKITPKSRYFPDEFAEALKIENKSDSVTDYFEPDSLRLLPNHPLYAQAKALIS